MAVSGSTLGLSSRVRSASPSRRALAIDMRRIANLLRDPAAAVAGAGEASMNTSICSSPQSAWEPGDRGAAPTTSGSSARAASISRMVMQNQFTALAERINMSVSTLQRQCEADRRRVTQVEKKLETKLDERSDKGDGRERWAEIQGSVNGLLEETQALARRVEGLDERLWARTSGSELSKQRNRELEQQVQALEQQSRLSVAATEETQKRQATKLRRAEHTLEEVVRRMAKVEEEVRQRNSVSHRDGYLEARLNSLEQNQESFEAELRVLQASLDDGVQQLREEMVANVQDGSGPLDLASAHDEVFRKFEIGLSSLEKKVSCQIQETSASLASLRVKVDGQLSRVASLAERLETAHEPAMDSLRAEISQARSQERRELDAEVHSLKLRMQEAQEANEEVNSEIREAMRQARAEIAALSLRPAEAEDNSWIRGLEDRLAGHEQELYDLRVRMDEMPEAGNADDMAPEKMPEEELEDLRRRLEWIEEQNASGAASGKMEISRIAQVQNTVVELVEQVSRLKQQASSSEASTNSWQQQVQQLQSLLERRQNEDMASSRVTAEVEAKVGAVSSQVADIAARLLEVEGNLDFARETEAGLGEVSALSHISETSGVIRNTSNLPPLPRSEADRAGSAGNGQSHSNLQEKLEAVAEHLEVVDELSDRVAELERRVTAGAGGSDCPANLGGASPAPASEVSFGGDGPFKVQAESFSKELGDLQSRCQGAEQELSSLRKELQGKLSALEASAKAAAKQEALDALKADVGSLRESLAGQPAKQSEEVGKALADLKKELASLRDEGLEDLKAEVDTIRDGLAKQPTSQVKSEVRSEVSDLQSKVRSEVSDLQSKVDAALEDLGKGLTEAKSAVEASIAPIKQELKELRENSGDSDDVIAALKGVEEVRAKLGSLGKDMEELKKTDLADQLAELKLKVERMPEQGASSNSPREPSDGALVSRLDALEKQLEEVAGLPKRLEEEHKGAVEQKERLADLGESLDGLSGKHASLLKELSDLKSELKTEVDTLGKRVEEVAVAGNDDKATQSLDQKELEGMRQTLGQVQEKMKDAEDSIAKLESNASKAPAAAAASPAELDALRSQLKAVEEKVASAGAVSAAGAPAAPAEDEALRAQVQKQVQELAAQISKELASFAEHQKDLVDTKATVEELSKKCQAPPAGQEEAIAGLKKQVSDAVERASAAEKTCAQLQKELEPLTGPKQKVGISLGGGSESPLAEMRGKLEQLCEQVAELQTKAEDAADAVVVSRSKSPQKSKGLEIQIPVSAENSVVDESLNFSLTEQTERPGFAADGSLNFSLTENATKDLSISDFGKARVGSRCSTEEDFEIDDDVPVAAAKATNAKPGGSSDDASKDTSSADAGRPRPNPVKTDEEKSSSLAPVAEEANEGGEASPSSKGSSVGRAALKSASMKSPAAASVDSPMGGSGGGLDASFSQVSVSCNEVSMGGDYSVDDSLELENKCDFVEVVRPISRGAQRQETIQETAEETEDGASKLLGTKTGAGGGDMLDSLVKPKAAGSDALDSLLGGAARTKSPVGASSSPANNASVSVSSAAKSPKAKASPAPKAKPKATSPDKDDDDDYGDASFDNMSVPESIEEDSMDGSGSGAWGGSGSA
eukprot:TRINITY_DN4822_c0_g1_i4.p1 TRINITY_DN4822_c0_g1~~TRINITY_DN4822_c0_g1_i4.p1  ORF type:complete len:1651 (+),score=530.46 TRINITY_DN4822_c0_g1_i4:89-4954(+)